MINKNDITFIQNKGITEEELEKQLEYFKTGFPFLRLYGAAEIGKGIHHLKEEDIASYEKIWENYKGSDCEIVKFVPASGAASRMFKNIFEFVDGKDELPNDEFMKKFFDNIEDFAFYEILNEACLNLYNKDIQKLIEEKSYKNICKALLQKEGLNYGNLPKGLLKFHTYKSSVRTPVEEHLVEAALYSTPKSGKTKLHFTISKEHEELFKELVKEKMPTYAKRYGVSYDISFSQQKPSTDTVAVDINNNILRDKEGNMIFRPGGHGALIENLNEIDADIIFIKNIDNVVPDRLKNDTVLYKKLIAGILVEVQEKVFQYIHTLKQSKYDDEILKDIYKFVKEKLNIILEKEPLGEEGRNLLLNKLDRPIRVCGMVRNVGEPGGGPFWVYNNDGSISLQILESTQIDKKDEDSKLMFEKGTHFNPVDLVCGTKNYKGEKFNLIDFIDRQTGFISEKSKNGIDLKALELPGLWNGAMSNWNTIFVEVPLSTFNPVKTVNDLLRHEHQPE